ncbi:MAG: molybdopterin synthase catalytic subunit MoaE [Burkholderiaceae bacterium]|nr:molybdopterin synthase catalytic subunit MoaE [Burkholderiaceae bacterium]
MLNKNVRIQPEAFDVGVELRQLRQRSDGGWDTRVGAVASFVGTVRDLNEGDAVSTLTLEHYPGMTESSIQEILDQAKARWPLFNARVIHRIGTLAPADEIVWVGVTSGHREAALEACAFIMDFLKSRAPFWKKESTGSGDRWVSARQKDEDALKQWGPAADGG